MPSNVPGAAGNAYGSYTQGQSADDAAKLMRPYASTGEHAAGNMQRSFFGGNGGNPTGFNNSLEMQMNQFGIRQIERNSLFRRSAEGRNPVDASGNLTSGAGMLDYQNDMAGAHRGIFGGWTGQNNLIARQGMAASGVKGLYGMDAATAYGHGVGKFGDTAGNLFDQYWGNRPLTQNSPTTQTASPWVNPDTNWNTGSAGAFYS